MGSQKFAVLFCWFSRALLLAAISLLKSDLWEGSVAKPPGSLVALLKKSSAGLP